MSPDLLHLPAASPTIVCVDNAERIRVLLAQIPAMMSDIVKEAVADEQDMVVVGECADREALLGALGAGRADVLIVGTSEPEHSELPSTFLAKSPGVKVLMLAVTGRCAVMYELPPHRTALTDVSPRGLLDAIRSRSANVGTA